MPLHFRGVAHPPPARGGGARANVADLNAAEISCTNLGRKGGTPLLVEHDSGAQVGKVVASWEGRDGSLRVAGVVNEPSVAGEVRAGRLRGLSLGTGVVLDGNGDALIRSQDELSLCVEPRRGGCYVDTVDGKRVHHTERASASGACVDAYSPPPFPHFVLLPLSILGRSIINIAW